jgi:ribonuclease R
VAGKRERDEGRPLKERIVQLISRAEYRPLDTVELSKALGLHSSLRRSLRDALHELEVEGAIARIRKDRYVLPQVAQLVTGRIEFHRNGTAHLIAEKQGQADVLITGENCGTALHGDQVVVRIEETRGERLEGRVIRIVARKTSRVVGTLQKSPRFHYVVPDDPRIPHDIYVEPTPAARIGDKVVVRLDAWESRHVNPEGTIVEVLGPANAPGIDIISIIKKHDLPERFPEEALAEADRISEEIDPNEIERREDCRKDLIITIDPDDAKDFDDAIFVEKTQHGWRLQVHIADVSHYVTPGGALDREARFRGNSTYLVDRVIPMLPERLSNGICSLKPSVERLTFAAIVDFDEQGRPKRSRFTKAVIRSAHRFTYKQAFAILNERAGSEQNRGRDGGRGKQVKTAPLPDVKDVPNAIRARLHTAWELASLLRKNRFAAGSLDLDFPEIKVRLDENGRPARLERIENDISHQLIEEFMLAANEAVARTLKNRLLPTVYRVHEKPDPTRLKEFREIAGTHGIKMGNPEVRGEIQRALRQVRGQPEEFAVKMALLRRLMRARYDIQPLGHYGLSKSDYTHFTSPIRRYADLLVHRSLEAAIQQSQQSGPKSQGGRRKPVRTTVRELGEIAEHISKTERTSAEAESESVQLKKMEFFERQLTSRKPQEFRAIVTEVRSFGLVVDLPDAGQGGVIHVSTLGPEFFQFDPVRMAFFSRRSKKRFTLGDELTVIVSRVDRFKRQVDFVPA